MGTKMIVSLLLLLMWYQLSQATVMVPASPCRDMFSYQVHPDSNQIIGYIQLSGLNADIKNTLEVKVYEGASGTGQKTDLHMYKSLESTYNDMKNYGTAIYWLNFKKQNPLPVLVSMSLNGKLICAGTPRQAVRTMAHSIMPPNTVGSRFSASPQSPAKPVVTISVPVETQYQATTMDPASPCSDMFSYRVRPDTEEIIGYIQLSGLNANVKNTLEVKVYEGASGTGQKTTLHMYKSLESTYNDMKNYGTATYWLNFELQYPIPALVSMSVNGKLICAGTPRQAVRTMAHSIIPPDTVGSRFSAPPQTTAKPVVTISAPVETQNICGTSTLLTDLSFKGTPSRKGQFPWAVPLFHRNSTSGLEYFCGGTIVTNRHILTAAHCVMNKRPQKILAIPGKHSISDTSATNGAVHANVQQIVCHEDYDSDSEHLVDQDADIAVLRLEKSLHFTNFIRPLCLLLDQSPLSVTRNHKGVVSGWGITENGHTNTPFYYTSTIVSRQQCSNNMDVSIPNRARLFCGDGSGSVACDGDSGSAMAMKRNNRFYLRGLVSKAARDPITQKCDTTKYVMYTDVSKFIHWILQHINDDDYFDY